MIAIDIVSFAFVGALCILMDLSYTASIIYTATTVSWIHTVFPWLGGLSLGLLARKRWWLGFMYILIWMFASPSTRMTSCWVLGAYSLVGLLLWRPMNPNPNPKVEFCVGGTLKRE